MGIGDRLAAQSSVVATAIMQARAIEELLACGRFYMEHLRDGRVIHDEYFDNLVTTVGKNLLLDTILAGSAFTATVVMGLKGTGSAASGDTQSSHAGWNEVGLANAPTYTGSRKTPAWSAASGGSKATSANVSFSITSSGTVAGAFLNINGSATVDNTTGTLFSAGDFGSSRSVINGDTLNVGYTLSV